MASNSSTPSTSNTASTNNMAIHESNIINSSATMNISIQSSEPSTNNITVQGNISNLNMQITTKFMPGEPPQSYGLPSLPTSNMTIHDSTFTNSSVRMHQHDNQSMPREPPQYYGLLRLPTIVNKRKADIRKLHALMSEHHKVVITGMAGLGKTTLANLCARKWVEDGTYQHAIFVNMETDKSASGVFKRLAEIVLNSQVYSESTIEEIYSRYNEKKTLLILDNIEQNSMLSKYDPPKELTNIDILGTSQFTELERLFHPYSLRVLSKRASFKLVMDIFKNNNIEEHNTVDTEPVIHDLVDKLEFHPLALQHAAALIIDMYYYDKYYDKVSLKQCLNKYMEHFETQLKQKFPTDQPSKYRKSVYAAISLNIKKATIGKEHVKSLLHCMTYLDPSGIDIKMFYKAFSINHVEVSLRQLRRFSLISIDRDMISMHRLVPQVCHAMLTADDKIKNLNSLFNIFFYYTNEHWHLSIYKHCSFLIEHFEMYFKISKEELAAYYKAAFYNNKQIKERLTARLQMINCVISDTECWSVQQCCVFAGHESFYKYFNGMDSATNKVYTSDAGFVQVMRDSSVSLFHLYEQSILKFYKDNKEELNKPVFKNLTILSICAAFGIRDNDFKSLIDMGCDVNIKDNNGMTPILWAAKNMCYEKVFTLLHRGATCDVRHKEVLTAAAAGDGESVLKLLQISEVSFAIAHYGKTLLWWAAGEGHHKIGRELIERGTDTSGADGRGNTLLHMVARRGYDETVSQFIRAVVDINIPNSDGDTALILAARCGHDKIVSQLIHAKADVNIESRLGETALISAAINGHVKIVTKLVDEKAKPNIQNSDGYTALMCAARNGHDEIVARLIAAKANIHIESRLGNTARSLAAFNRHDGIVAQILNVEVGHNIETSLGNISLISAAARGDVITVIRLIGAKVDPNIVDSHGNTALMFAADKGHREILVELIGAKADLNKVNSNVCTALMLAAANGDDEIVSELINANANLNILNNYGDTALILAVAYGHDKIVSKLIGAGANVNIANSHGETALILAARYGPDKIVSQLIGAEANVNIANSYGNTALILAAKYGHDKIVSELIGAEANVNIVSSSGYTALILAANKGHDKIVSELIGAEANVNIASSHGDTALIRAASYGHDKIVSQLIGAEANVNIANSDGDTALILAARCGHDKITFQLAQADANVNVADSRSRTPLLAAAEFKHREISMYLIKKGASVNTVDGHGDTPLLLAAKHGDYELALELINRGARTDTPANNEGETPLSWARRNKDDRMCALFQVNERTGLCQCNVL